MSTIEEDSGARLAERLRLEREARNWTLDEVAARSSVSRAMISKVERGEASPTAAVLVRLASAFDLTLGGLLARAEQAPGPVVREADQPVWRDPASGYLRRQIFARHDHPVELIWVELPGGARVGMPAASYSRIRQLAWVMEGRLVIENGGARHELSKGDCYAFGAPADTIFANQSPDPCVYIVALTRS